MATIRKRLGPGGKTVWQAQIIRKGHKPLYKTCDRRPEAITWVQQIESEMAHGTYVSRAEAENTTLAKALDVI